MSKRGCEADGDDEAARKKQRTRVEIQTTNKRYRPRLVDVQNLILRTFTTEYGENPKWLCVRGMPFIDAALVLVAPFLDAPSVRKLGSKVPVLSALLESPGSTIANFTGEMLGLPPDQRVGSVAGQVLRLLLTAAVKPTVVDRRKLPKAPPADNRAVSENTPMAASELLASPADLLRSMYPAMHEASSEWISTADFSEAAGGAEEAAKLFALDCEMVQTRSGLVLARVSVVDASRTVVLDDLVKPQEEVEDYLTQYSGITKELLEGVETTLSDVQAKLKKLLRKDSILIGHSLENDFRALKVVHDRVIDTAILYSHARGWPHRNSLKGLVQSFLKRGLDRSKGHDSVADAIAALELVQLKMEKGPGFGAPRTKSQPLGQLLRAAGSQLALVEAPEEHGCWHYMDAQHMTIGAGETSEEKSAGSSARVVKMQVLPELEFSCQTEEVGENFSKLTAEMVKLDGMVKNAILQLQPDDMLMLITTSGPRPSSAKTSKGSVPGEASEVHRQQRQTEDAFAVFLTGAEARLAASAQVQQSRAPVTYDV